MDRRGLYDDRAYWKQALSLKKNGAKIYYLVIDYNENETKRSGTTNEGIHFQIIRAKKYLENIVANYAAKKFLKLPNEFHLMLKEVEKIQPDLIQIVDLRVLRILKELKELESRPKIIYDIREPRDSNLVDIRLKNWKIPHKAKQKYAAYIQKWEYEQAGKCDFILGVDDGIAKRARKHLQGIPYETIYNFTDLAEKRENISLHDRKFDAAYIGGLSEIRGAKTVIEALKITVKYKPQIQFLLVGKSYDLHLEEWIENYVVENALQNNLTWIKGVDYQDISEWYNQIRIGLNPLHYVKAHEEIIQIKLFEYMNYGIPVITSDFGEMQRYITENEAGICIEPDNPEKLAAAVIHLLENPEEMKNYGQNGIAAVDNRYNWASMERKYLKIVENLLQN